MRLQLIRSARVLATVAVLGGSSHVSADGGNGVWRLGADTLVSTDTDNVVVVSPQLSVHRALDADGSELRARAIVDVVSAASVDVVSQATRGFHETREEVGLGGTYATHGLRPSLDYRFSTEPDYMSNGLHAAVTANLGSPDSVLAVGYGATYDIVGRRGTPFSDWSRTLWNHQADVSLTQTLGQNTLVRAIYSLSVQDGYLAKVYRYVPLFTAAGVARAQADNVRIGLDNFESYRLPQRVTENVPTLRVGHAFGLRALHYIHAIDASIRVDAQIYLDSWGLLGLMTEPAVTFDLGTHVAAVGFGRFYWQSDVSFWQRQYVVSSADSVPQWRTLDRQLSSFTNSTGGLRLEWHNDSLAIYVEGTVTYTHFGDYIFLDHRTALTTLLGARWTL